MRVPESSDDLPSQTPPLVLNLPEPWAAGSTFELHVDRPLTWLVGPNGAGKSRFLHSLRNSLPSSAKVRLLGTDRLSAVRDAEGFEAWGKRFPQGLQKSSFPQFLYINDRNGSLLGVTVLLQARPDLRIRVEATMSQLLGRSIQLTMTDGNLKPRMQAAHGSEYDLFESEAHGVLELIALLTNLYDDQVGVLLIDEPELNLHPQYQAFLLSEIRRVQGKQVVLATHSPFMLDVRTTSELENVLVFHPDFRIPSSYRGDGGVTEEVRALLPRMTEQHRTFFFATKPVFVEGYFDATVVGGIQRALGLSAEAGGSSVIPASGKDDVSRFLMLCTAMGKEAIFVLDLDALFDQRLSRGVGQHQALAERVAAAGQGTYEALRGQLEREMNLLITAILDAGEALPALLLPLRERLRAKSELRYRRVALLVALSKHAEALAQVTNAAQVSSIQGRFNAVLGHLASVQVYVLPNGALENNLPSYTGNPYEIADSAKVTSSQEELLWLATPRSEHDIMARYGALAKVVRSLPAQPAVDIRPVLKDEIADLLHTVIKGIRNSRIRIDTDVPAIVGEERWSQWAGLFRFEQITVQDPEHFSGRIIVMDRFGLGELYCTFTETSQTNNPASLILQPILWETRSV